MDEWMGQTLAWVILVHKPSVIYHKNFRCSLSNRFRVLVSHSQRELSLLLDIPAFRFILLREEYKVLVKRKYGTHLQFVLLQ